MKIWYLLAWIGNDIHEYVVIAVTSEEAEHTAQSYNMDDNYEWQLTVELGLSNTLEARVITQIIR